MIASNLIQNEEEYITIDKRSVNPRCAFCKRKVASNRTYPILILEDTDYYEAWQVHTSCWLIVLRNMPKNKERFKDLAIPPRNGRPRSGQELKIYDANLPDTDIMISSNE